MDCRKIKELLNERMDFSLSPEQERQVREHAAACPACAREAEELAAYRGLVARSFRGAKAPKLSPSFDERFFARLQKEERRSLRELLREKLSGFLSLPARQAMAGALALALVGLAGIEVYLSVSRAARVNSAPGAGGSLLEVAVDRNRNAEQQHLVEARAKDLLKDLL
ncbi:MAG: anti-sigma factor family protein [Endomicrobiales bacterium]